MKFSTQKPETHSKLKDIYIPINGIDPNKNQKIVTQTRTPTPLATRTRLHH